jgi:hypothetical protein
MPSTIEKLTCKELLRSGETALINLQWSYGDCQLKLWCSLVLEPPKTLMTAATQLEKTLPFKTT